MLPIRDDIPRFSCAPAVWVLIAANTLAFVAIVRTDPVDLELFYALWGMMPARFTNPNWAGIVGFPFSEYITLVSALFLHADALSFFFNLWALWLFGPALEEELGFWGLLLVYALCGIAGWGGYIALEPESQLPAVGASGAIAGLIGAYALRFPHARTLVFLPMLRFPPYGAVPASVFQLVWLACQLVLAAMSQHAESIAITPGWTTLATALAVGVLIQPLFARSRPQD